MLLLIQIYGLGLETTNSFDTKSKYEAYDRIANDISNKIVNSGIRKIVNMGRVEYEFNKRLWSPIELNSNEDAFLQERRKEQEGYGTSKKQDKKPTNSYYSQPVKFEFTDSIIGNNGPDKNAIRTTYGSSFGSHAELSFSTVHESAIEHQKREMSKLVNNYRPVTGDPYYKINLNFP